MQPTRVFGDGQYKYMKFFRGWKNAHKFADSAWTPPYVTAKPDVSCYRLEEHDRFMVVSTDGLFQDLSSEQVVECVGAVLDEYGVCGDDVNVSTLLIRKALLAAGRYFDGNLQSEELNLSSVLNLHQKMKRSVHDDLTVLTLFFDENCPGVDAEAAPKNNGKEVKVPPTLSKLFAQGAQSKL